MLRVGTTDQAVVVVVVGWWHTCHSNSNRANLPLACCQAVFHGLLPVIILWERRTIMAVVLFSFVGPKLVPVIILVVVIVVSQQCRS